jgi:hypothetical protein
MGGTIHQLQSAATAQGNGTELNVKGVNTVGLQVTGTFVGTVVFEGTVEGSFVQIYGVNPNDGSAANQATAAGLFLIPVAGLTSFRARVSAYTSGSITVVAWATGEIMSYWTNEAT